MGEERRLGLESFRRPHCGWRPGTGRHLGERLSWPQDRLNELSEEQAELFKQLPEDARNQWSCDRVMQINQFVEKRVQVGEMQALRYFRDMPR